MQLHRYLVSTKSLDRLWQNQFLLVNLQTNLILDRFTDLLAGYRTKGLAVGTRFDGQCHRSSL